MLMMKEKPDRLPDDRGMREVGSARDRRHPRVRGARLDEGPRRSACSRERYSHRSRVPSARRLSGGGSGGDRRRARLHRRHLPGVPGCCLLGGLALPCRGLFGSRFLAVFFPSIGISISSFCPAETLRDFLPFAGASVAMLFLSASMRSTTFSPRGRGLRSMVLPLRLASISSVKASSW